MKKKKYIYALVILFLLSLLLVRYSSAFFKKTKTGDSFQLAVACLDLTMVDEGNAIKMQNAVPMTDEQGRELTPYTFTIKNTCDTNVYYEVNLEMLGGTTLSNKYIKTIFNDNVRNLNDYNDASTTFPESVSSKLLYLGQLSANEEKDFSLTLYMDADTAVDYDAMNKKLSSKIVLGGTLQPTDNFDGIAINVVGEGSVSKSIISSNDPIKRLVAEAADDYVLSKVECSNGIVGDWNKKQVTGKVDVDFTVPEGVNNGICNVYFTDRNSNIKINGNGRGFVYYDFDKIAIGESKTFEIAPEPGYHIGNINCDKDYEFSAYNYGDNANGYLQQTVTITNNNIFNDGVCIVDFVPNKLTFNLNHNNATGDNTPVICNYGEDCYIPVVTMSYEKHKFTDKWNTKGDLSGTEYNTNDNLKNVIKSGSMDLFAKWVETALVEGKELYYNGASQELLNKPEIDENKIQYSLDGNNWSNVIPTGIDVGDYQVYYRFIDENYVGVTEYVTVSISKGNGTANVSISNWTYGTTASNPLISSDDYSIEDAEVEWFDSSKNKLEERPTNNSIPGTYYIKVKFSENGNYLSYESDYVEFSIQKAEGEGSVTIDGWIYGENTSEPSSVSSTNGTDNVTYTWYDKDKNQLSSKPTSLTDAGDYYVKATFAETDYYKEYTTDYELFTIEKANGSGSVVLDGWTYGGEVSTPVPSSSTNNVLSVSYLYFDSSKNAIETPNSNTLPGHYYVKAVFNSTVNYKEYTTDFVEFEVIKATGDGSVTVDNWVYGTASSNPVPTSSKNGTDNVTYAWYDANKVLLSVKPDNNSEVGTYYVKATFGETDCYNEFTTDYIPFNITKSLGSGSVDINGWIYGESINEPVPESTTNSTVGVTYTYYDSNKEQIGNPTSLTKPGTYYVKGTFKENINFESYTTDYVEFVISKASGSGNVVIDSWVYGSEVSEPIPTSTTNGTSNVVYTWYGPTMSVLSQKPTSTSLPGKYYVKATFAETEYYNAYVTDYVEFTIEKANSDGNVTMSGWVYGGTPSDPVVTSSVYDSDNVTYKYYDSNKEEISKPTSTSIPGDYYVKAIFAATENYNEYTTDYVGFKIIKAAGYGTVSMNGWTYGENETNPSVTSDRNGTSNVTYKYYDSTYSEINKPNSSSKAGIYYVKATFAETDCYNEYTTDYSSFTVLKATGDGSVTINGWVYGQDDNSPVPVSDKNGIENVSYLWFNSNKEEIPTKPNNSSNVGTYFVKAVFASNDYYNEFTTDFVEFAITKADGSGTVTMSGSIYGENVSEPVSSSSTNGTDNVSYKYYNSAKTEISKPDNTSDAGTYYVRATFGATDNYNEYTTDFVSFVISKAPGSGNVTMSGWIYGESASDPVPSSTTNNGDVTYTWYGSTKELLSVKPTSTSIPGTYYVKATFAETKNYTSYTTDYVAFNIVKASGDANLTLNGWTYGQQDNDPNITSSKYDVSTVNYKYYDSNKEEIGSKPVSTSKPGTYYVKAFFDANENYDPYETDYVTFVISKASGSGSVTMNGWIYGENASNPSPSSDRNGTVNVSYEYFDASHNPISKPGSKSKSADYYVKATFAETDYYTEYTTDYVKFTISKANGSGDVSITSWTYGEKDNDPVPTSTTNGTTDVTYKYYDSGYNIIPTKPTSTDLPGIYYVKATFAETENYTEYTTDFKQFSISKASGEGSITISGWTYGEKDNSPVPTSSKNGTGNVTYVYYDKNDEVLSSKPISTSKPDTYYVKAIFGATNKYTQYETGKISFTISKAPGSGSVEIDGWKYNGTPTNPTATSTTNGTSDVTYAWFDGSKNPVSKPTGTSIPGNYYVKGTFAETEYYNEYTTDYVLFVISKDTTTNCNVSISGWTYGDTEANPVPTCATNGTSNVTYEWYDSNKEILSSRPTGESKPGTYYVKAIFAATDKYNECSTGLVPFTISKAPGSGSIAMNGWTYGGTPTNPTATSTTNGTSNVTYSWYDADENPISKPTSSSDAGTYKVKATFAATDYYNAYTTPDFVSFTISKKAGNCSISFSGWGFGSNPSTPVVTSTTNDASKAVITYYNSNKIEMPDPTSSTDAGSYYVRAVCPEAKNYTSAATGYEPFTITTVPGSGDVAMSGWVYNGTPTNPVPYSTTNGIGNVTYQYFDKDYNPISKPGSTSDVGKYYVKATFGATNNYREYTTDYKLFEITQDDGYGTVSMNDWIYSESPSNPVVASTKNGTSNVSYQYYDKDYKPISKPGSTSDAGIYYVKATFAATNNYKEYTTGYELFNILPHDGSGSVTIDDWYYAGSISEPKPTSSTNGTGNVTYSWFDSNMTPMSKPSNMNDVGTYYVKATFAATNNYKAYTTNAVSFEIKLGTGSGSVTIADWTYNGTPTNPTPSSTTNSAAAADVSYLWYDGNKTPLPSKPTGTSKPGDYYVRAVFKANDKYNAVTSDYYGFKINKDTYKNCTLTMNGWVYSETVKNPSITCTPNATPTYTWYDGSKNQISKPTSTSIPGTYYVKATLPETDYYQSYTTGFVAFTISRFTDTNCSVSISGWTYGETAKNPVPSCVTNGTVSYTWYDPDNKIMATRPTSTSKPGTYSVTATFAATDIYNAVTTAPVSFTISKADGDGSITMSGWTYGGAATSPIPTSSKNGTGNVSYTWYDPDNKKMPTRPTSTSKPGKYYVEATFGATDYYNAYTTPELTEFTIEKANGTCSISIQDWKYNGTLYEPVPISSTNGTDHVTYTWYDSSRKAISKPTITSPVAKYYVIGTFATTDYYKACTSNEAGFNINLGIGTGDVTMNGWTYGGTVTNPTPTSATNGTSNVTYTWYDKDENPISKPTSTSTPGTYYVKATFAATTTYDKVETGLKAFTISKASGSGTVTMTGWTYGETVTNPTPTSTTNSTAAADMSYTWYDSAKNPISKPTSTSLPGTYYVKGTFKTNDNYTAYTTDYVSFAISQANGDCKITFAGFEYGETVPDPVITTSTYDKSKAIVTWYNSSKTSISKPTSTTTPGIYYLKLEFAATDNYKACSTGYIPFTISKAPGSGSVEMNGWTYGGTVTNPTPTSTKNGTSNVTYEWYDSNKEILPSRPTGESKPGTYYVKATFAATTIYNAYTTDYKAFTISKASGDGSATLASWKYGSTPNEPVPTSNKNGTAANTVSYAYYKSDKSPMSKPTSTTDEGSYYFKATFNANDYYNAYTTDFIPFTILPADGSGSFTISNWTYGSTPSTPVPTSTTNGTTGVTYKWYDSSNFPMSNPTSTTDAGTYYVEATFPAVQNYASYTTAKKTVTISPADGYGTVSINDWVYATTASQPNPVSSKNGTGNVTYQWYDATKNPTSQPTDMSPPGTYYVKATFAATTNYKSYTTDYVEFHIQKLTASMLSYSNANYTNCEDVQCALDELYDKLK